MPYLGVFPDRNTAVSALAGCTAGFIAVLVAHPVESIKVRMQANQTGFRWRDLASLVRNPYYGILPHLPHYAAMNVLRFGGYEFAKPLFGVRSGTEPTFAQRFGAGSFSGLIVAATLHPFFVVRVIQQANRYSFRDTLTQLWQREGMRGFYRTYDLNLLRLGFAFGVFFGAYPLVRERLAARFPEWPTLSRSLAGGCTGVLTWSSIYPLDVVQSRLVAQKIGDRSYTGARHCVQTMVAEGGWRIFGRGYSAVLIRAFPVNAILLPVADSCSGFYRQHLPEGRDVWRDQPG